MADAESTVTASPTVPLPAEIIFSPDTRTVATDTSTFPNSAIGRLQITWPNGKSGGCSGALVTPFHVLTAGHCVSSSSQGGGATTISFSPGQLGNNIGGGRSDFQPFGQANAVITRSFPEWTIDGDHDYDVAMLTLDRQVGNFTGAFKWGYNSDDDWYDGRTAYSGGYPSDLNGTSRLDMYGASGTISAEQEDILESQSLDSYKGQSGSPIYFFNNQSERVIHAVLSGSSYPLVGSDYNRFTRITAEKSDTFKGWIAWDNSNFMPNDRPDLVDYDTWFQSGMSFNGPSNSVQPGEPIDALAFVYNMGTAPSGPYKVRFRLSQDGQYDGLDVLLGTVSMPSLAPFQSAAAVMQSYMPTNFPTGTNLNVVWSIDPDDDINEFTESNQRGIGDTTYTVLSGLFDDHGNTSGTAKLVSVPSTTYGDLQYPADVDYFKFTAVGGAQYQLETQLNSLADSALTLYGTNGTTQLAYNDDIYPSVPRSQIVWTAPADGTYFAKVSDAGLGNYTFSVKAIDDHGNSTSQATFVEVPSDIPGTIAPASDADWFEFKAHVGGVYTIETTMGTLDDGLLTLYDPFGDPVAFDGSVACFRLVCELQIVHTAQFNDTYYARVTGGSGNAGTYTLRVSVDDDWGDSKLQAAQLLQKIGWDGQALPLGEKGELENPGDVDWFAFVATGGVEYTIETTLKTLPNSTLTVFGTNGTTQLAFNDDHNGAASRIVWTAPSLAVFYVQVAAPGDETGTYDLKITAGDDHPTAQASTDVLESGPFVDGNIVLPEDSDWFKIWAKAGERHVLETSEGTLRDGTLAVYDGDGRTRLAFNDNAPGIVPIPGSRIEWTAPRDGNYYIVVGSKASSTPGSYIIRSQVDDVGNTTNAARAVPVPYFGDGNLEVAGDSDWYSFRAIEGQTYLIRTYLGDLADSTLALYEVAPFPDDVRLLEFNDNRSENDSASLIEWTAPRNGRYYVRVGSAQAHRHGTYTLVIGNPDEHADASAGAPRVGNDSTTPGVIGALGDADWFSFPAMAGQAYTLDVELAGLPSATLVLYDRDGTTPLGSAEVNVEANGDIVWTAPTDGIYFAKVAGEQDGVLGTYSLDISSGIPNTPPTVSGVALGGTVWTQAFREYLTFGLSDHFGYAVGAGSEIQLDPLPWTNLNQIRMRLNERVVVQQDSLSLVDDRGTDYSSQITGFAYDPVASVATWTLARPLEANTYIATLSDRITDPLGTALDGEWIDGESSYPSGDGTPGGAFRFRFNIVPGDVDRNSAVDRVDLRRNLDAQFSIIGSPNYTIFGDLDGDGVINVLDWSRIRDRLAVRGAVAAPAAALSGTSRSPTSYNLRAEIVDRLLRVKEIIHRPSVSHATVANPTDDRVTAVSRALRADRRSSDVDLRNLPGQLSSISVRRQA